MSPVEIRNATPDEVAILKSVKPRGRNGGPSHGFIDEVRKKLKEGPITIVLTGDDINKAISKKESIRDAFSKGEIHLTVQKGVKETKIIVQLNK